MLGSAISQVVHRGEQCRGGVGEVVDKHADFLSRVSLEHRLHAAPCGLYGRADLIVSVRLAGLDDDLTAIGCVPAAADETAPLGLVASVPIAWRTLDACPAHRTS